MEDSATRIEGSLWLGNQQATACEEADVIISVLAEDEVRHYQIKEHVGEREWHWIPAADKEEEELLPHFRKIHQVIRDAVAANKTVLVHCGYGISRSPAVVAAYLMLEHGYSRRTAVQWISKRRPIICPNDGFMNQLLSLEVSLEIQAHE